MKSIDKVLPKAMESHEVATEARLVDIKEGTKEKRYKMWIWKILDKQRLRRTSDLRVWESCGIHRHWRIEEYARI